VEGKITRYRNLLQTIQNYSKIRHVVLITQRSRVQIPPPQPYVNPSAARLCSALSFQQIVIKSAQNGT
jgi:hypothetical protein